MNEAAEQTVEGLTRRAEAALGRRDFRLAHESCIAVLARRPDSADAFFLLAMIAAEHGNYGKAAEVLERALRIDPARSEFHAQFGRCMIALHRPAEALAAAARALAASPRDALTFDTIGVVMTRAGAHAEAVTPFSRAVERAPAKAAYHCNLAASLRFSGEFSSAARSYRRALELDPGLYHAWASLAQLQKSSLTAAETVRLETALNGGISGIDDELHVCHALAKQYEDEGRFGEAFAFLERGKRRKREAVRYSPAADRAVFAAAPETAPAASDPGRAGHGSIEPIFIVGMPRTGTTLVERILSSHPAVFAAGELTHFSLALKRAVQTPSNLVLDPETLRAASEIDLAAIGAEYVESTRPRTGHTRHFIDKMPLNFFYAGLIHRALPNAKIICLRRNPLDTALSNYRQLFATSFSYYNYAYDLLDTGRYYIEFDRLARHWLKTIPANYCEVHYESVVADTEREARRLVAFCGLDWDPACLRFEENAAPVATASSVQVRQPIYRTAVERWRKYETELRPLIDLFAAEGIIEGRS